MTQALAQHRASGLDSLRPTQRRKKTVPIVHLRELGDSTNATFRQHGGGEVPVRDGWCTAIIVMKLLVLCKIAVSGDNVVYSLATGDYSHAVLMRVLTDV